MESRLRTIGPSDWEEFRDLRLRALADAPDAFGVTLLEASGQPPGVWRDRAAGPGPVVLAYTDEQPVGLGGLHLPEDADDAFVWGMWVDPASRGRGLAARILGQLLEQADRDRRAVVLHVTQGNDGARRLYLRHGFEATGEVQPLRPGSDVLIDTLRRG